LHIRRRAIAGSRAHEPMLPVSRKDFRVKGLVLEGE
jgi:hypothetical protein